MEVHHKHHPIHGWREFLKESGIIVLGVLTALAAEQTVEWLHWRDQVQEGRAAIKGEMQLALDDVVLRRDLAPCVVRRTAELEAWVDSYRAGRPLTPRARIGRIIPYWPINQVWETFRASPMAMHLATDERMRFAKFYGEVDVIRSVDGADRAIWLDLARSSP